MGALDAYMCVLSQYFKRLERLEKLATSSLEEALGWWYDHHHSYAFPLWLYTGVSLVGALTFAVLKRPPSAAPGPGTPAAGRPQASA
jgi:hypothetical protein